MTRIFEHLPKKVAVHEVGLRDGLQNEPATVGTARKLRLVDALIEAGLKRIEVTSFVSPRWIPQLADADELARLLPRDRGVQYSALCPNMRGLERAKAAGMDEIAVFLSASEAHNQRNINKSIARTLGVFDELIPAALAAGVRVRSYISTVWGCPYQGEVPIAKAVKLAQRLLALGCYEVSLGDTIGVGTPLQTQRILDAFLEHIPADQLAMHMHDTRGQALANVLVGLSMGITTFDSAIAGLGGCPYAPGASGNLATEDLIYMLANMNIDTGIEQQPLWDAGRVAAAVLNRELPGRVHRAGLRALRG